MRLDTTFCSYIKLGAPFTFVNGGGGLYDLPACGPPANFFVHLASTAVTPAGLSIKR